MPTHPVPLYCWESGLTSWKKNEAYDLEKVDDDEHGEGGEENEVFWVTG